MEPTSIFAPPLRPLTIALLTITSLTAFDALSVYAALPAIGADLGDVSFLSWVITGYLLASAVAILVSGPLIDGWGAQRTFRVAIIAFLVATAGCAASPNLALLVVARVLQGLGGGVSVAVGLVSVGLTHPESLRARGFAAQSLVWSVVGFGGPPLVAGLVVTTGWRGVFAVNIPLTLVSLAFGWKRVPAGRVGAERVRFDRVGIALVTTFTAAIMIGLAALSARTVAWLALAAAAIALYLRHARRSSDAVVAPRHLLASPRGALSLNVFLVLAGALGVESFLPIYIRGALGRSEGLAAFGVLFLTIGWSTGSFVSSWLVDTISAQRQIFISTVVLPMFMLLTGAAVARTHSVTLIGSGYAAVGLSVGAVSTLGLTVLQDRTPEDELGRVNAAHQYVRTVAISAGVALATGIVLALVAHRIGDVEALRGLLEGEDAALDRAAVTAFRSGYVWAHVIGAAITALAIVPATRLVRARR